MSDEALEECTAVASSAGTIGGSSTLLPGVVRWLPEGFPDTEGMSPDETDVAYNESFEEAFGIGTDDFLELRVDADEATTARIGEPPGAGEMAGDEWFIERDAELMRLWNDRYPESAGLFCDLVASGG